jgi:RES domain
MILPPLASFKQDNTHRLIPSRYVDGGASVLAALADDQAQLDHIFELDMATNPRLTAESAGLPGISKELVFGVPYAHIINGCFANPHPLGSRFNGPDRGAWYAAISLETSQREVAYHRKQWFEETNWDRESVSTYVDFLADFRSEVHDLRAPAGFEQYLDPDDYSASQTLAATLLQQKSLGVVYPSVRHAGGTCIACFRPVLVANVRKGASTTLRYDPAIRNIVIT